MNTAYDIFVSYSHPDRERVKVLVAALEAEGWNVFWDRTIPPGESWRSFIGAPLAAAPVVIVCWTRDSVESDWVGQEADAAAKRKVLMPVFLDHVTPPLGLGHIHAADLVDWTAAGGGKLPHVLKLAIVRKLPPGGPPAAEAAAPPDIERPRRAPPPPVAPAPAPAPAAAASNRSRLYALLGAVTAIVAAVAVGGYFMLAGPASKPPAASGASASRPQPPAGHPPGHSEIGQLRQDEMRDANGKVTVEASIIHVIACSGGGTAGIYVYAYTKRPGFRAVQPPNWGTALGGRDFPTLAEAIEAGCGSRPASSAGTQPPAHPPGLTPLGPPNDGWLLKSGDILRYYGSPSEAACRADCEREGGNCQSYTWVKPEGYQKGDPPVCYLMKSFGEAGRHTCCVTSVRGPFPPR